MLNQDFEFSYMSHTKIYDWILEDFELKFNFEVKKYPKNGIGCLRTLKWRMQIATPFSFIDSFIGKLLDGQSQTESRSLILKSTHLNISLIKGRRP